MLESNLRSTYFLHGEKLGEVRGGAERNFRAPSWSIAVVAFLSRDLQTVPTGRT